MDFVQAYGHVIPFHVEESSHMREYYLVVICEFGRMSVVAEEVAIRFEQLDFSG